jgi:hypothetical protein
MRKAFPKIYSPEMDLLFIEPGKAFPNQIRKALTVKTGVNHLKGGIHEVTNFV